ncbi:MAG: AAA family ATPase [Candidatus Liptonbacteria bacterium]|nr:AAA family ATPase [Candidatus Liptonbacteria bacterium]
MRELKSKTIIVICGVVLSGKSTIAREVSKELGIRHLDVDNDIRFPIFGKPEQGADLSPEGKEQERLEMLSSYKVFLAAADELITLGRSVILTATFSREIYWEMIREVMAKHPDASLKVVQC